MFIRVNKLCSRDSTEAIHPHPGTELIVIPACAHTPTHKHHSAPLFSVYFNASLHHQRGNTTQNRNNTNGQQPPRTGSPELYGRPWLSFFFALSGFLLLCPTLCPVCACGPPQVMTSSDSTAASRQQTAYETRPFYP